MRRIAPGGAVAVLVAAATLTSSPSPAGAALRPHHAQAVAHRAATTAARTPATLPEACGDTTRIELLLVKWLQASGRSVRPATTSPCPAPSLLLGLATRPVAAAPTSSPPPPARSAPVPATAPAGYGCAAALTYLKAHAASDYTLVCPGDSGGHEGMTCDNWPGICPGQKVIVISDPCPVAYMNEASNSLVFDHLSTAPIDPFGYSCPS